MKVVIHQPDFLPYLGFFHRLLQCDTWAVMDHVQFLRRGWHHRDRIKTAHGVSWLTLPVQKCPQETPIREVLLSTDENWREDHLHLLREAYRKAPHFTEVFPHIEELYHARCGRMMDFNLLSIDMLMRLLDVPPPARVLTSALPCEGRKTDLLVDILRRLGAEEYLSGTGARDYLDPAAFERAGIRLHWQAFEHPVYPQIHGPFEPFLSSVDALFNCGVAGARDLLRSC